MCDSNSNSGILIGDPPISSAPPLILLQSEEETANQESTARTGEGTAGVKPVSVSSPALSGIEQAPGTWSSTETPSTVPQGAQGTWNIDPELTVDKNPFNELTEEHLNRLDDVLSSEEVQSFLQQTTLNELDPQLVQDSATLTAVADSGGNAMPTLAEETLKFDIFDNPTPDADLNIDQSLVQDLMQDSIREHDLVAMAAAFSDHAYAMSNVTADAAIFSPRKSARIKQRMDDGKCAFESDSDFEYYFTPKRMSRKDLSDVSDADKATSSPASCPAESASPATGSKSKQPKRRSTRIVDMENREKAEKILQENRRQEQEAKAALQRQQEEEARKSETDGQTEQEAGPSKAKRAKKGVAKAGRAKKDKTESEEESEHSEDKDVKAPGPGRKKGKAMAKQSAAGGRKPKASAGSSPRKRRASASFNTSDAPSSSEDDDIPLQAIAKSKKQHEKVDEKQTLANETEDQNTLQDSTGEKQISDGKTEEKLKPDDKLAEKQTPDIETMEEQKADDTKKEKQKPLVKTGEAQTLVGKAGEKQKPLGKAEEMPVGKAGEKQKPVENAGETPVGKAGEKQKPEEKAEETPVGKAGEKQKPVEKAGKMPVGKAGEKQKPLGKAGETPVGKAGEKQKPLGKAGAIPVGKAGEKQKPLGKAGVAPTPVGKAGEKQKPVGKADEKVKMGKKTGPKPKKIFPVDSQELKVRKKPGPKPKVRLGQNPQEDEKAGPRLLTKKKVGFIRNKMIPKKTRLSLQDGAKKAKKQMKNEETAAQTKEQKGSKTDADSSMDKPANAENKSGVGVSPKAQDADKPVAAKPAKHKHRKSEEIVIDPTVCDLFKPDGVIPNPEITDSSAVDSLQHISRSSQDSVNRRSLESAEDVAKVLAESPKTQLDNKGPRMVSILSGLPVLKASMAQKAADGSSSKPPAQKTADGTSSQPQAQQVVYVSVHSDKGEVKIVHSLQKDQKKKDQSDVDRNKPGVQKMNADAEKPKPVSGKVVTEKILVKTVAETSKSTVTKTGSESDKSKSILKTQLEKGKSFVTKTVADREKSKSNAVKVEPGKSKSIVVKKEAPFDVQPTSLPQTDRSKPLAVEKQEKGKQQPNTPVKVEQQSSSQEKAEPETSSQEKAEQRSGSQTDTTTASSSQEKLERQLSASEKGERQSLFEVLSQQSQMETDAEAGATNMLKHLVEKKRKESAEKKNKSDNKGRPPKEADGHESGDLSFEDDENDSDWEPANDPDTLYCICRKPHGNRFMICCDRCGEWYHGQCVGVSKQQGQQLERQNREYVCPVCSGQDVSEGKLVPQENSDKKASADSNKERKHSSELSKRKSSSDDGVSSKKHKGSKEKWASQRCVARDCKRDARLGSVFCSTSCIGRHARDSLRALRAEKARVTGQAADPRPSETEHVVVMERRSGQVLTGSSAPTEAQLELWLQTHPSFEVVQSTPTRSSSSSSSHSKKLHDRRGSHSSSGSSRKGDIKVEESGRKEDKKSEETSGSSRSSKTDDGPDQVRLSVRKSLRDALAQRAEEADDIMMKSSEIKQIALRIEDELHHLYGNTGHKYRAKFRSLLFNIKDQKNTGLFRKILSRRIRSRDLVKMTSEELASRELTLWRKRENKHTLAMIEQTEKEALKEGQHHIVKKTHKGEVAVEDEDMSTLVTHLENQKGKSEGKAEEENSSSTLLVDTTDQHRAHLFDLNCKICTGKMMPPVAPEPTPKKVQVVHGADGGDKTKKKRVTKEVTIREEVEVKHMEMEAEEVVASALREAQTEVVPMDAEPLPPSPPPPPPPSTPPAVSQPAVSTSSVAVRSPDSALQSGLDVKHKFTPSGPMAWKGFIAMQDFAKFFTSAYRVSGPVDGLSLPDTLQICGRIGPDQMWDYLGKIRQAGSKDLCILRFIPGSDDEKVAYVHLYSYLNSRSRCGVVGNVVKQIKDLYIVPLASHSKIPQVLLPFDGPGLESNRPHMLIGIVVRQKGKRPADGRESDVSSSGGTVKKLHSSSKPHGQGQPAKKAKAWKEQVPEAYSPTADGEEAVAASALYIPTPTAVATVASVSSSSSSTPSSIKQTPVAATSANAEPYSPSKDLEMDEDDEPYDPADDDELKKKKGDVSSTVVTTSGATIVANPATVLVSATVVPVTLTASTPVTSFTAPSTVLSALAAVLGTPAAVFSTPVIAVSTPASITSTPASITSTPATITSMPATVTSTPATVSSTPVTVTSTTTAVLSTLTNNSQPESEVSIDNVMEKISGSTDPEQISSLMVSVLAKAKDASEQQKLMAELTSRIEKHKQVKAGTLQQALKTATTPASPGPVPAPAPATPSFSTVLENVADGSSGGSVAVADSQPAAPPVARISTLTPGAQNMPPALKALLDELQGNTHMARAVDRRTERERKEWEKKEAADKAAEKEAEANKKAQPAKSQDVPKEPVKGRDDAVADDKDSAIPGLGGIKDMGEETAVVGQSGVSKGGEFVSPDVSHIEKPTPDTEKKHPSSSDGDVVAKGVLAKLSVSELSIAVEPEVWHAGSANFPPKPVPPPATTCSFTFPLPSAPTRAGSILEEAGTIMDIDHRSYPPAGFPPAMNLRPPAGLARGPLQPPPPGTEASEDGDVDMRHRPPRSLPVHPIDPRADRYPPPPLPPLPPQPPPPLPPLPMSHSAQLPPLPPSQSEGPEAPRRSQPEHAWPQSVESSSDFDYRQRPTFSHQPQRHHSSASHHYHDRDDRHRKDHHSYRDRH